MKKIELKIKGMHCQACEYLIKDILEEAGAKSVSCSFKGGSATVEFDEAKLSEDKIKKLIHDEGYEAE